MKQEITWQDKGQTRKARWRSEAGLPVPASVETVDAALPADAAWKMMESGIALLWRGDWPAARRLMQELTRRADRLFAPRGQPPKTPAAAFALHRELQGRRATLLARLLVPLGPDYKSPLPRAQDVRQPCREAWGKPDGNTSVVALRELLALISAHEWRKKGIKVAATGGRIHPHYGVFSPVRGEYVDLVARAPLPAGCDLAFDIGTGSGILACVLARRGITRIVATDQDARALACASENVQSLGLSDAIEVVHADLFPEGLSPLIVCNPPWLPAQPTSPIEYAVYDPDSRMLRSFLAGLASHLPPSGEGWLIISDLAEHLGLRSREQLLAWIAGAGLRVLGRLDTRPTHAKAQNSNDLLQTARATEITSLWRLGKT